MAHHQPYRKSTYPSNWAIIAFQTKQERGWKYECCSIIQGDDPHNNITVHHLDHNTFNNDPSNLNVLCQKCHLRTEGIYRHLNINSRKLISKFETGQLLLPNFPKPEFPQLNTLGSIPPHLVKEPGIEPTPSLV